MATWQWIRWQDKNYLTCDLLSPWPHGFFTRHFWPQAPAELTPVLQADTTVYRLKQVHGNRIISPRQMASASTALREELTRPEADALISDATRQALWVCSADCSPVLIADRGSGQVAAVHAGWRGTALKIVPLTVEKLLAQGNQLENLVVAIGPAIAGEVYQVSVSVAAQVGRTIFPSVDASDVAVTEALLALEDSPLHPDAEPGRMRLDVRRVNAVQLQQMGLTPGQISLAPHCTFQEPEQFFSYRRTHEKKVQWSGIVSR